jgi:hypothetical protein
MSNIVEIKPATHEAAQAAIVKMLETWIDDVKSGTLVGVMIGGMKPNGDVTTEWSNPLKNRDAIYCVTVLHHRIVAAAEISEGA